MQLVDIQPDIDYSYLNALFYQTRKNRSAGSDKEKLRTHIGISDYESTLLLKRLTVNGWITEEGDSVVLTAEGLAYIIGKRRGKTHASISFTAVTELAQEREASVYRFDYVTRDHTMRQFSQSITVSIDHDVCREWKMRGFDKNVNNPILINILRRYALEHVSACLINGNLGPHEKLRLGADRLKHGCRYESDNLPNGDAWEYEVEWTMHSR